MAVFTPETCVIRLPISPSSTRLPRILICASRRLELNLTVRQAARPIAAAVQALAADVAK